MKEKRKYVVCSIFVSFVGIVICLLIFRNRLTVESRDENDIVAQLIRQNELLGEEDERLKKFLSENGIMVQLLGGDTSEEIPIVEPETIGISLYEYSDKIDAMTAIPLLLYYPHSDKVRLHFQMDLSRRLKRWELYAILPNSKEVLVPSDPKESNYYFLDLVERGNYIMHVKDLENSGNDFYFPIAW